MISAWSTGFPIFWFAPQCLLRGTVEDENLDDYAQGNIGLQWWLHNSNLRQDGSDRQGFGKAPTMIISSTSPVQIHEQLSLARLSKDFKCQLEMLNFFWYICFHSHGHSSVTSGSIKGGESHFKPEILFKIVLSSPAAWLAQLLSQKRDNRDARKGELRPGQRHRNGPANEAWNHSHRQFYPSLAETSG